MKGGVKQEKIKMQYSFTFYSYNIIFSEPKNNYRAFFHDRTKTPTKRKHKHSSYTKKQGSFDGILKDYINRSCRPNKLLYFVTTLQNTNFYPFVCKKFLII